MCHKPSLVSDFGGVPDFLILQPKICAPVILICWIKKAYPSYSRVIEISRISSVVTFVSTPCRMRSCTE